MCGIFGIISNKKKVLDKRAFFTLGVDNDSRGGDACGIFIDGQVEYGTGATKKYFAAFYEESKLLSGRVTSEIAFGHCRKASVGGTDPALAQPCIIKNKEGKIEFVVLHNGTISNHAALAKKYIPEINIAGMSDSQIMTNIFYYTGYDALAEYVGGGVFVIADYRGDEPAVYMYKGSSKRNNYDKEAEEERPLYYVNSHNSLIFSSLSTFLFTLYYKETVYYVPTNVLLQYHKESNSLIEITKYDRSNQIQSYSGLSYDYYNDYSGYSKKGGDLFPNYKDFPSSADSNTGLIIKKDEEDVPQDDDNSDLNLGMCHIDFNLETLRYELKMYGSGLSRVPNGMFHLNKWGNIGSEKSDAYIDAYFIEGILIRNHSLYEYLNKIANLFNLTISDIYEGYPELINYCAAVPYYDITLHKNKLLYKFNLKQNIYSPITGVYSIPFSSIIITVCKGTITKVVNYSITSESNFDFGFRLLTNLAKGKVSNELDKFCAALYY